MVSYLGSHSLPAFQSNLVLQPANLACIFLTTGSQVLVFDFPKGSPKFLWFCLCLQASIVAVHFPHSSLCYLNPKYLVQHSISFYPLLELGNGTASQNHNETKYQVEDFCGSCMCLFFLVWLGYSLCSLLFVLSLQHYLLLAFFCSSTVSQM